MCFEVVADESSESKICENKCPTFNNQQQYASGFTRSREFGGWGVVIRLALDLPRYCQWTPPMDMAMDCPRTAHGLPIARPPSTAHKNWVNQRSVT